MMTQRNNFRVEALHHNLSQAENNKQAVSFRLEKAKKVFISADEANIATTTKLLDFKASKPNGNGAEGLSKGAATFYRSAVRAQKRTQDKCEKAIKDLESLQYEFADASKDVRDAKRELREGTA